MKLRMFLVLALTIIVSFALVTAQTKGDKAKETSDKKSECPMTNMKSGSKDCCKKGEAGSKDCCKKDGKMSENCTKGDKAKCDMSKDGKMSENCSKSDKAKCDMSKSGSKDCCKDKVKGTSGTKSETKSDKESK